MPERFLLQILRNLVTHGILQSVRGVDGGYTLERKPEDISLLEVIEAVDGPLSSGAPVAEGLPQESQLKLREALEQVTATSRRQLSEIKLASLLKKAGGRERGAASRDQGPGQGRRSVIGGWSSP